MPGEVFIRLPHRRNTEAPNKEYNTRALINARFTYNILKHLSFTGTARV